MVWTAHTIFHFNGTFSFGLKKIQEYQILDTIVVSPISIAWNSRSVQLLEDLLIFPFTLL